VRRIRISKKLVFWIILGSILWASGVPLAVAYLLPGPVLVWWWWQQGLANRYRDGGIPR
jgi:hypothetical protein